MAKTGNSDASSSVEVSPAILELQKQKDAIEAQAKELAKQIRAIRVEEDAARAEAFKATIAPQIAELQTTFDALAGQMPDNLTLKVVDGTVTVLVKRARRSASRVYEWVTTDGGDVFTTMQAGLAALGITEADVMEFAKDPEHAPGGVVPKHHTTCYTALRTKYVFEKFGLKRREVKAA